MCVCQGVNFYNYDYYRDEIKLDGVEFRKLEIHGKKPSLSIPYAIRHLRYKVGTVFPIL